MAQSTIIKVKNNTGATIPSCRAVYLSGYDSISGVSTIALSSYNNEATMPAVGITRDEIGAGQIGIVKTNGLLSGFDTSSVSESAEVYVGLNGVLIFTDPFNISTSTISQQIATVAYSASEDRGQIFLFPLEIKRRVRHPDLLDVTINQHHNKTHATQHAAGGSDELLHSMLANKEADDHLQYSLVNGTRAFTGTVGGIDPLLSTDLATKAYIDNIIGSGAAGVSEYTFGQNKKFWNDSLATIRKDLDGYASDTTVSEHYAQHSEAIQTILKDLDGYVNPDLSGYAANTTVSEHYAQHSEAIQTILKDLDGYVAAPNTAAIGDGYVAFFIDGGRQIAGDNDLYWDRVNNSLGVGTSTPINKLHVVGPASFSDASSVNNHINIYTLDGGGYSGNLLLDATAFKIYSNSVIRDTYIGAGNVPDAIVIKGDTRRVGIGINSPDSLLTVKGGTLSVQDSTGNGIINITPSDGGGYAGFILLDGVALKIYNNATSRDTYIGAGNIADALVIKGDTRRVGIGTTAPTSLLTVAGDVSIGGDILNKDLSQTIQSIRQACDGYAVGGDEVTAPNAEAIGDGYVAFFINGGRQIAGDNDLYWDRVKNVLNIGPVDLTTASGLSIMGKQDKGGALYVKRSDSTNCCSYVANFRASVPDIEATDDLESTISFTQDDATNRMGSIIGNVGFARDGADNSGRFVVTPYNVGIAVEDAFTIKSSGAIGIGTASPISKLSVQINTAATSGRVAAFHLKIKSSGSLTAGTGIGMYFSNEDTSGGYGNQTLGGLFLERESSTADWEGRMIFVTTGVDSVVHDRMALTARGTLAIGETYTDTTSEEVGGLFVEGKVGIGTAAPTSLLTVAGDVSIGGDILNKDLSQTIQSIKQACDGYTSILNTAAIGDGYVAFFIDGDKQIAGDNDFYWNRELNRLELDGYLIPKTDNIHDLGTSTKRWKSVNVGPGSIHLVTTDAETGTGRDWNIAVGTDEGKGYLQIHEGNKAKFTINTNGGVGINIAQPVAALHVNGSQYITGTSSALTMISGNSTAANGVKLNVYRSRGTYEVPTVTSAEDELFNLYCVGYGSAGWNAAAQLIIAADGVYAGSNIAGSFRFTTRALSDGDYAERMRLTNAGNVGIGVSAPQNKLDVDGAVVIGSGASYAGSATAPANGLLVEGAVGIGTTAPTSLLTVAGDVSIGGDILNKDLSQTIQSIRQACDGYATTASVSEYVAAPNTAAIGDGYVAFFIDGGRQIAGDNDLFWDRENNRLGIGTSNPQRKVVITDDSNDGTLTFLAYHNKSTIDLSASVVSFRTDTTGAGNSTFVELAAYSVDFITHDHATRAADMSFFSSSNGTFYTYKFKSTGEFWISELAAGATPDAGFGAIYAKSADGKLYYKDDAGIEYDLTASVSGLDITVSEHYAQHSNAIQDILKSLDGYGSGTGTGDITGSGLDGYVTYWTGEKTIGGDGSLYYDEFDGYLGVGTQEPNERLTISQGAISIEAVADAPAEEPNFGKLYVTFDGKLMFVREDGEKIDLTAFTGDIDGGSFFDTYLNTNDIDAGSF